MQMQNITTKFNQCFDEFRENTGLTPSDHISEYLAYCQLKTSLEMNNTLGAILGELNTHASLLKRLDK